MPVVSLRCSNPDFTSGCFSYHNIDMAVNSFVLNGVVSFFISFPCFWCNRVFRGLYIFTLLFRLIVTLLTCKLHNFVIVWFKLRIYCVKSVQIRSYFWSVSLRIQSEYRKIRTRNNLKFGHFTQWLSQRFINITVIVFIIFEFCEI